ncbi:hypothetical protein [Mycobacterium sp.]|uniref:hypothetical protein n=1 Tax=Mycobacterium sp. TaxID=1785 RepID=UPI003C742CD6
MLDRLAPVRVDGPLAPYAVGFGESLVQQGYSQWTTIAHLQLMECVSRWLAARGMDAAGLTDTVVDAFLAERRASGQVRRLTRRGMIPLLGYLRASGAAPRSEPVPVDAGRISGSLVDAVPAAVGWRRRSFPPELTRSQVARLLNCCDRNSATGRRDYAILVLLARLGLRAGEVAALRVNDVDCARPATAQRHLDLDRPQWTPVYDPTR